MKINEISEMTMRGSSYDAAAQKFVDANKQRWAKSEYIGDIENFRVLREGIYYSVWDNQTIVAAASLSNATSEVDDVWVNPDYRGQKVFSMLLWFFKTRLGRSKLMIGQIHSPQMQEVVKGLSRFNKSWVNIRTNQQEPFSLDTLDNFYSLAGPTPWRLVIENAGEFNEWPMFNTGSSFIKESYSPYID